MTLGSTIQGLQEAQRDNLKMIAALHPSRGLARGVQAALTDLERFAVSVTHVDTGALRASHRMRMELGANDALGTIYIDPGAMNPRSNKRVVDYAGTEHARGDIHAFYERTYNEEGDRAMELAVGVIEAGL
jgi:hypothetical protein